MFRIRVEEGQGLRLKVQGLGRGVHCSCAKLFLFLIESSSSCCEPGIFQGIASTTLTAGSRWAHDRRRNPLAAQLYIGLASRAAESWLGVVAGANAVDSSCWDYVVDMLTTSSLLFFLPFPTVGVGSLDAKLSHSAVCSSPAST